MRRRRSVGSTALALVAVIALAACGGSSSSSSSASSSGSSSTPSSGGKTGGTVTEVIGTAPDSLDPGMGYTTQALEPDQVAYVPLLAYTHEAGAAGGKL